ncbi:hypothetical protein N0V83_007730 [Neocucurbitaria cava]|uniref:Uncharacterized protein n=1 Tax=Neocucurbitaria cava TaxID=798079 RepID=A0A9W8Y482_9PLEO|nr:hypothetical protein N0V83_007730 [Neocucurbitaria cava]
MALHSVSAHGSPEATLSWPVNDEQSAMLVRHFIITVSQFFDFCDEQRHFARVVPIRARSDSTLANAMLACSARHLSLTTTFDYTVADAYYQQCLQALIPAIATRVDDETLLAATVILRFMEELELPMTGRDSQHHLLGTQALVRAYEQQCHSETPSSSLLDAAKLAAFRQDMYMALTVQRPMNLSKRAMFPCHGDLSQAISETDWANFAIAHCCDALEFAFAEGPQSVEDYRKLRMANDDWRRSKPASFEPFFSTSGRKSVLPDVRYMADWHSMGNLYNLLARLLLLTHDPELPRLGLARRIAIKTADENIRTNLLSMAGIAKSNCDTCSSLLVASMAIAMFGDRLTIAAEQDVMDQILGETQARCGWPTNAARQMLRTAWQLA